MHEAAHPSSLESQRIAELEATLAATTRELAATASKLAEAERAFARLREKGARALEELQLLHRRLHIAKAERIDTAVEQLAFDKMLDEVQDLAKAIEVAAASQVNAAQPAAEGTTASPDANANANAEKKPDKGDGRKNRSTPPAGRRDLSMTDLPVERVEIPDPELEGKVPRLGFENSQRLGYQRGGLRRIVLARVVYDTSALEPAAVAPTEREARSPRAEPNATFQTATAALPKEIVRRGMLAPSMIAYVLIEKYAMGVPFYRLEAKLAWGEFPLARGTMCRYAEDVGATLGCIVEAARKEAIRTAFCLATDATGVAIQPTPLDDGKRQPCRKGHFFVTLADRDHVFFDYQPKHTSLVVWDMFKGFSGYIQADAHAIYDCLFRGTPPEGAEDNDDARSPPPTEVGCWAHSRRKFWEAAVCKHPVGLEGLRHIDTLFAADRELSDLPPSKRKERRNAAVRPLVDDFFEWVKVEQTKLPGRGLVATALGYAVHQEQPFRRFLDDGRLRLDNNPAESALRTIAVARKAWLFFGSDDHASSAGNVFSLLASCKLHRLDPEAYLAESIRVLPSWPSDRSLELAPKYWPRTRARLAPEELKLPLGHISVPPPLPPEQKGATR